MAFQPTEPEGLDTTTWFRNNGLQDMIELVHKNGWTLEVLMFAEEPELKALCQEWNLSTSTTIKFSSAMRKLKQSNLVKDNIVILGAEENQILDNLFDKKAKIKHDITQYQNAQNNLKNDIVFLTKQIHSSCDSIIETINKYRDELLHDIHNKKQKTMLEINVGLKKLNQAFQTIHVGHKQCQHIAKDDEINMSTKLNDMNEIATKYNINSLYKDIDTNVVNKRLTLKFNKKGFRNNLQKNIRITFETDEKFTQPESVRFNSNFKSENGIILTENNKYCQSHTKSGSDVWIIADIIPVKHGRHCWRVYTINPMRRYILWGVSEMKMYNKERSNDTIYGITNNDKYWPFNKNICKRDQVKLSKFMDKEFEMDILIDCDNKMIQFRVVGNDKDDNNAWIMINSFDKSGDIGWVPHFELEGCLNGPKLRICKIPIEWFGKGKKSTLLL